MPNAGKRKKPDKPPGTKKQAKTAKRKKMYLDYVGVTYNKTHAKYQACIMHYRKQHYLGRYKLACDAAKSYDQAAVLLKGDSWKINFDSVEEYNTAREKEIEVMIAKKKKKIEGDEEETNAFDEENFRSTLVVTFSSEESLKDKLGMNETVAPPPPHSRPNQGFDDIDLYKRLLSKENVVKVELAGVKVKHNGFFCQGLASTYRITYDDGRTEMYKDKGNFQARGYYTYHRSSRKLTDELELENGEFICGLYLQQGDIVDGITFVTNQRQVHIGGRGGSFKDMTYPTKKHSRRIIAFAGEFHGVLSRIGYYSVKIGWETVREYVMLRWLLENNRAKDASFNNRDLVRAHKDQVCIRWVLNPDTPKDVMRHVLRYLF